MAYRIASLDLDREPHALDVAAGDTGFAVLLRRGGRPIGFVLRALPDRERPDRIALGELLDPAMQERALCQAIEDELPMPLDLAPPANLSLGIAICTKDRPDWLGRCLRSLDALDERSVAALGSLDIVVIDNASSDGRTRDVASTHPRVRYVREEKPGLNFARNRALREAAGDLVAFLDDDVVVDPGWLGGIVAAWQAVPELALIAGQVLPLELESEAQILFERRGGFRHGFDRLDFSERLGRIVFPCRPEVLGTGANMIVRREHALALGGFDEALDTGAGLPGGGDLDMFYRLARAGHAVVYEPGCLVFHHHRRSIDELRRQFRNSWGAAYMAFAAKSWFFDPTMRGRWTLVILRWYAKQSLHLIGSLLGRDVRPAGLILAELAGGLAGLCGGYRRSRRRVERIREEFS